MSDDSQSELPLKVKRPITRVDDETIACQPSELAAFKLTIARSGLTDDQICKELVIDAGQWSRICKGSAHFPMNKTNDFMDVCGSEALLQYLNYSRGYESLPPRRMSQLEKDLKLTTKRAVDAEKKNAYLLEIINGRR